jgi:hypothetical protein
MAAAEEVGADDSVSPGFGEGGIEKWVDWNFHGSKESRNDGLGWAESKTAGWWV